MCGFGRIAGLGQIALGGGIVATAHGRVGGVEVGHGVVGIHAHGNVEHLVELGRAGFEALCGHEELIEREVARAFLHYGKNLGGVAVGAHHVVYAVVGVTQRGVHVGQQVRYIL